jgi:hypothetical protein
MASATLSPELVGILADKLGQSISQAFSTITFDQEELEGLPEEAKKRRKKLQFDHQMRGDLKRLFVDRRHAEANGQSYQAVVKEMLSLGDQISFEEVRSLIPAVMSEVVDEAAEPEAVITSLMQRIPLPDTLHVEFPMVGAIADAEEVGPGNEYPIRKFSFSSQGVARMGKYGLRMEIQDEVTNYVKGWDIFGMMLRACGRAMIRTKEKKAAAHLASIGTVYFDNLDSGVLNTSGIGPTGAQNGSFTLDDLVAMSGDLINAGFIPDLVIINGLAWTIFARTPELREMVMASGQGPLFRFPEGKGGAHPQGSRNPLGALWTTSAPLATTYTNPDSSLLGRSFKTAVSPYQGYTAASATTPALTDIIVADSRYVGAILEGEPVSTEEFDDPRIDVRSIKFKESYAIASLAQGAGIRIAKNVAIARGIDPLMAFQLTLAAGNATFPGASTAIW